MAAKYRNKKLVVDGITFDSTKEGNRYIDLKILQKEGIISKLEIQPDFPLEVNGRPVKIRSPKRPNGTKVKYIADFSYTQDGEYIVEDVKGFDTPLSRLKRAIVEAIYGIEIKIV